MALGNLADLEELEPTPGRPDPLTLYHKVGTSQEGTEGRCNDGWGSLLSGTGRGQVRREELCVYWGVPPIQSSFCIYHVHIQGGQGCLRSVLGSLPGSGRSWICPLGPPFSTAYPCPSWSIVEVKHCESTEVGGGVLTWWGWG